MYSTKFVSDERNPHVRHILVDSFSRFSAREALRPRLQMLWAQRRLVVGYGVRAFVSTHRPINHGFPDNGLGNCIFNRLINGIYWLINSMYKPIN